MALGLNEQELNSLLLFGDTVEEIKLNVFGHDNHITNEGQQAAIIHAITGKIAQIVSENNKRITEQLISAGINLSVSARYSLLQ